MKLVDVLEVLVNPVLAMAALWLNCIGLNLAALFVSMMLAAIIVGNIVECIQVGREISRKADRINKRFGR